MQIGASVNSAANTYYGMKQNVRRFQGVKSNADGITVSSSEQIELYKKKLKLHREFEEIAEEKALKKQLQEKETETDIIVKPDGSRVLVVTMNMGGMETTMSLEISKPTTMPNDSSEQGKEAETIETDKITEEDLVNEYKCD